MTQSATYIERSPLVDVGDVIVSKKATIVGDIVRDQAVVFLDTAVNDATDLSTFSRSLVTCTADVVGGTDNLSRALDIVTASTAGSLSVVRVGDVLRIATAAAGTVTEIIDNTNVRVDTSGTISADTWDYQRPCFAKVFAGATITHTATTEIVVLAKTSDFVVTTTTSGTLSTVDFISYENVDSVVAWKEDDTLGKVDALSMDSFTYSTTNTSKDMQFKVAGVYSRNLLSTADTAAGSVTNAVHDILRSRGLIGVVREIREF